MVLSNRPTARNRHLARHRMKRAGERNLAHRRRASLEEDSMGDRLTALIVGASRGLGLALAEEWLKRDARVIATVRSDSQELKTLQQRFPGSLEIKIVDVVDAASVRTLRDRLGDRKFDVLFVNAGICRAIEKTPSTVDEQDFI